jgi:spore photoproduct lyase
MVLFGNIDEGLSSLEEYLKQVAKDPDGDFPLADTSPRSHRFCTGEFTDSLLLDDVTHLAAKLVELFSKYPPALLELKTKTCQIQELIGLSHGQRTVVSFSVNSPEVVSKEEPRAATLTARLKAAEKLTRCGYQVGFHFDPLIHYKGWERGYQKTVETLFSIVDPQAIAWISLGCFRYLPNLKPLMLQKGAKSLFSEEFIKADDGKMRYPRPLRYLMYRTLMDFLGEKLSPSTILYLCMESGRLWNDLFGYDPGTPGLTKMFRPPFSPIAP